MVLRERQLGNRDEKNCSVVGMKEIVQGSRGLPRAPCRKRRSGKLGRTKDEAEEDGGKVGMCKLHSVIPLAIAKNNND